MNEKMKQFAAWTVEASHSMKISFGKTENSFNRPNVYILHSLAAYSTALFTSFDKKSLFIRALQLARQ